MMILTSFSLIDNTDSSSINRIVGLEEAKEKKNLKINTKK
jgi:hypothetical protein